MYEHWRVSEGIKPDLKRLRTCLERFTESCWKFKIGSGPFEYGEYKDYWGEIPSRYYNSYDKREFHEKRMEKFEQDYFVRDQFKADTLDMKLNALFC